MMKKMKVVLLGHPSSGKTAFLASLSENCPSGASAEAKEKLAVFSNALRNGEPLSATREKNSLPCRFEIELDDGKSVLVDSCDYAGELTRQFNNGYKMEDWRTSSAPELEHNIKSSNGVLLFADCHAIRRAGGWLPWYEENAESLMRFVEDVVTRSHPHPLMILLTRSDLVAEDFLSDALAGARDTLRDLKLNGDAMSFRAFTSKAGKPPPHNGDASLPEKFLAPVPETLEPEPAPAEPLRKLWRLHQKTRVLAHKLIGASILVALMVILFAVFLKESPVTSTMMETVVKLMPEDLANEVEAKRIAGRLYISPTAEASLPWSRLIRHWVRELDLDPDDKHLKEAKDAYVKKIMNWATKHTGELDYRAKEGVWHPGDKSRIVRQCEDDLRWLGAMDELSKLAKMKKPQLDKCEKLVLSYSELDTLTREYKRIDEAIPNWLSERLGTTVYGKCLNEATGKLKEYAGGNPDDLRKLYEEELPGLINSALDAGEEVIGRERYEKLSDARKYLDQLAKTDRLVFIFNTFHQQIADQYRPVWRVAVEPPINSVRKAWYYYPFTDTTKSTDEYYGEWGEGPTTEQNCDLQKYTVTFNWLYGDSITVEIHDVCYINGKIVTWKSNSLATFLKDSGHDLPGLTFMVFWEAHADWKLGMDKIHYRLELKKEGNGNEMIRPPAFLLEANKRR